MRGSPPHAGCFRIVSLSAGCSADPPSISDRSPGSSSSSAGRVAPLSAAQKTALTPTQDKPILAPPMFIFQRMSGPVKRTAEEDGSGAVVNKRVRSLTYPSLSSQTRKSPSDGNRRVRTSSLSFPPHSPVPRSNVFMPSNVHNQNSISPVTSSSHAKQKSLSLRPASLVSSKPRSSHNVPVLRQVGHDVDRDLPRVKINLPASADAREQRVSPEYSRSNSVAKTVTAASLQFVFGENMSERVLSPQERSEDLSDTDCSSSDSESSSTEAPTKMTARHTLWESAAAYTASSRRRCLLKQVQIITGEENESNVVQLTCKLFILERGTQSWTERGRGVLRLNDLQTKYKGCLQSRMVMRHQGSLKVILNTKLYPHTHLRRAARRNLQVTATDLESHSVRVFLIQANARDIARLYVAIHHRLVALRCSAAVFRKQEGHCTSEDDNDEEMVTYTRSGDLQQRSYHATSCPRTSL